MKKAIWAIISILGLYVTLGFLGGYLLGNYSLTTAAIGSVIGLAITIITAKGWGFFD